MKKYLALLLSVVMVIGMFAGCTGGGSDQPAGGEGGEAAGADPYTGIPYSSDTEYDYLYSEEITSMNYLATSVSANQKPLANFVDTLIEYDNLGNIVPDLATSWEESEDGLTWTFHLRDDAKWYTCEGEEYAPVTANDFVMAARLVADVKFDSDMPDMLTSYIVNGSELYNGVIDDFTQLGVEAVDDYTLVYHLKQPCAYFLTLLTYGCYLPVNQAFYESCEVENPTPTINDSGEEELVTNEFGTDYDKILYCGGYLCESWLPQEGITMVKNDKYFDADKIYITKVNGKYNAQADSIAPEMFLRGEIDECSVTTNILDEWLNGDNAQYVHQSKKLGTIMYMLFNFNPKMDDEAANEAYRAAVNNKNWRMSIVYGLNKAYCLSAYDPYYAEERVTNLMIPADFAMVDGKDYTEFGNLPELSKGFYDEAKALEFRDAAKAELEAAGVPLPIQIPVFYNPSTPNMDNSFQLIEKQLEELLGTDYIDITVYAGPTTNFIGEVRRPGKWGLYEQGWSPDYADPATYFEPFGYGWTFGSQEYIEGDEYKTGYIYTEEDYANNVIDDEELVGTPQMVFNSLVEAARAEKELNARYELFAKAEEYALTEGLMIPYQQYNDGYVASKLALYEAENAMAGICAYKYKGMHLLEKSYSMEEFEKATEAWEADKAK